MQLIHGIQNCSLCKQGGEQGGNAAPPQTEIHGEQAGTIKHSPMCRATCTLTALPIIVKR